MEVHNGEVRKGDGKTPYVLHPLEVGIIASIYTNSEVVISSAILHDVLETGKVKSEDLQNEFGEEVLKLVQAMTDDATIKDWAERKSENLTRLASNKVAYITRAIDALVNMQDLFAIIQDQGENAWTKFNAPKGLKMSYFERILGDLKNDLPNGLLEKYVSALKDLQYAHLMPNEKQCDIGFAARQ